MPSEKPTTEESGGGKDEPRSGRRVVLIHGQGLAPPPDALAALWQEALKRGLERDHGKAAKRLRDLPIDFVHYGDLTRPLIDAPEQPFDADLDLADRRTALAELARHDSSKKFRSENYHKQRGRSGSRKLFMQLGAPVARGLRMDDALIARVAPELARYREDPVFADALRARLLDVLKPALAAGENVLVVAHCIGAVIAWDVLWMLSRGEAAQSNKLTALVTLGAPLANDAVRLGLLGAEESGVRRYPGNIAHWFNLAAEDDWVCHDTTAANDFAPMLRERAISRIEDIGLFNLARRYGRPDPHEALGYLIHPRMARLLAEWLDDGIRGSGA